ncbi:putative mediator of RNA polymerase II transcription subunit 10 [Acephala macrosclerotiorum]|nr:putative mediator of RNA polymerase II transcription subunit 10 [Acephala macrosclerotiorum]
MAPVSQADHAAVEGQLKDVIQDLFQIMVQVNSYDLVPSHSSNLVLQNSIKSLHSSLQKVHRTANHPTANLPHIPPELIQYVDNGRNPDIYTREFVELGRKGNQLMKGKKEAFGSFRDVLAGEMCNVFPELRGDVERVVESTGGDVENLPAKKEES